MPTKLSRLIYLADKYRVPAPKTILRFLPQGELIGEILEMGLQQTILNSDLPEEQIYSLWEKGQYRVNKRKRKRVKHEGSPQELRYRISQTALNELEIRREDFSLKEYLKLTATINEFLSHSEELVVTREVSLGDDDEGEDIPKFASGFEPLDMITGGFYQGLVTLMGKPGHGKTSLMLTMMEELRRSNVVDELWFYEVEIPATLMLWKIKPMRQRVKFKSEDKLKAGEFTTKEILDRLQENPNPSRAIFVDGPDAMAVATSEGKRYVIENIYRDLIRIKELCQLVVVSSQVRKKDAAIVLESGAEAWQKAWYSDIIIGVQKLGRPASAGPGVHNVKANITKNRFGIEGRELIFPYNYTDLSWTLDEAQREEMLASEDW